MLFLNEMGMIGYEYDTYHYDFIPSTAKMESGIL